MARTEATPKSNVTDAPPPPPHTPGGSKQVRFEPGPLSQSGSRPPIKLRSPPPPAIPWQPPNDGSPTASFAPFANGHGPPHPFSDTPEGEVSDAHPADLVARPSVQFFTPPNDLSPDELCRMSSIVRKPTPHPRDMARSLARHQQLCQQRAQSAQLNGEPLSSGSGHDSLSPNDAADCQ